MVRGLLKRSGVHFAGLVAGRVISTATFIWLARVFSPSVFGEAVLFATLLSLTSALGAFGLNQWYQKQDENSASTSAFEKVFQARLLSLFISIIALGLFLQVTNSFSSMVSVLLILTLVPSSLLSIVEGYFLKRKEPLPLAFSYSGTLIPVLIGLVLFQSSLTFIVLIWLYFIGTLLTALILFPWKVINLSSFRFDLGKAVSTLKKSSKYAVLITTSFAYARGDSLVVRYSLSSSALGFYGAGYRYLEGLNLLPSALAMNLFHLSARKKGIQKKQLQQIIGIMFFLGLIAAVALYLSADLLTTYLLGPEYSPTAPLVRIFSGVLLLFFINSPLSTIVQSSDLLGKFLPWGISNTVLNILLNLLLVPIYGINSAAWVMLFTEFSGLIINLYFVKRVYRNL